MFRMRQLSGAAPLAVLFLLPLIWSFALLLPGLFDASSIARMFEHPQFWGGLGLTVLTGIVSTVLAFISSVFIVMGASTKSLSRAAMFLALPHLALALGLGFLLAPTGMLARLIVGGAAPPDWQLVQDPLGIGLIVALVLKETPFLIWAMASVMHSEAMALPLRQHTMVARSLGHGPRATFLKIVLPQVLPRMIWPLVAVFSYGMTVVDMALVIGPTQPPTLAQLVWTDLNDGETIANARGAAGTLVLSAVIALLLAGVWITLKLFRPVWNHMLTLPAVLEGNSLHISQNLWRLWLLIYVGVLAALLLQSVSQLWPYPQLLATAYTGKAWVNGLQNFKPILTTIGLGFATSIVTLAAVVLWFETQSTKRDGVVMLCATVMLCVPVLLVSLGHYRLLLQLGLTGTWAGLFSAHLLPVAAYVFVMLHGPYRGYDQRWQSVTQGLGAEHLRFLTTVKWPMLKVPMLSALAIGFAVSVAQFVPAQLAAAGRFSTLPMEAVTLTSGGNRALTSVYALLLMALPLIAFMLATWRSKSRWHNA